jgi:hypothetical protein
MNPAIRRVRVVRNLWTRFSESEFDSGWWLSLGRSSRPAIPLIRQSASSRQRTKCDGLSEIFGFGHRSKGGAILTFESEFGIESVTLRDKPYEAQTYATSLVIGIHCLEPGPFQRWLYLPQH